MPISTTEDYERALSIVATIIREWDPYALLEGGAPENEFNDQIARITARSHKMESSTDAALAVSEVFGDAFEAAYFTVESCTEVGFRLFEALSETSLIG